MLATVDKVGVKILAGNCLQGGGKGIRWQLLTGGGLRYSLATAYRVGVRVFASNC